MEFLSNKEMMSVSTGNGSEGEYSNKEMLVDVEDNDHVDLQDLHRFSREFSSFARKELAQELRRLRRYLQKELPAKRQEQEQRSFSLERELESLRHDEKLLLNLPQEIREAREHLQEIDREVQQMEVAFAKRKTSLWYRLRSRINPSYRFIEEAEANEKQSDLRARMQGIQNTIHSLETNSATATHRLDTNRHLREQIERQLAEMNEVITEEAVLDCMKMKLSKFYETQGEVVKDWRETQNVRSIQAQTEKQNSLFVHGIPFEELMADTGGNNQIIDTRELSAEEKALFVAAMQPTLSVSTKTLDPATEKMFKQYGTQEIMYKTGLILGGGTIMRASSSDGATFVESLDIKYPKYSADRSSVQTDIEKAIQKSIGAEGREKQYGWNEFVVRRPTISALYVCGDLDREDTLTRMQKLARILDIPLIRIEEGGVLRDISDDNEVKRGDLISGGRLYDVRSRMNFVDAIRGVEQSMVEQRVRALSQ